MPKGFCLGIRVKLSLDKRSIGHLFSVFSKSNYSYKLHKFKYYNKTNILVRRVVSLPTFLAGTIVVVAMIFAVVPAVVTFLLLVVT